VKTILHLLTRPDDPLARIVIEKQRALEQVAVETIDLSRPEADYARVVERLFAADSIEVW
jgi:hypothetical protein